MADGFCQVADNRLRESLQKTIEHQKRRPAQVMAILELATQTQPFSL
jgi:hypothetical protein